MSVYSSTRRMLLSKQYTWLITGVAGFIGSNLLESLLSLNQKVVGLDDFSIGSWDNLDEVHNMLPRQFETNFKLITGSICSEDVCVRAVSGVDFILHHAAIASVPLSIQYPEITHKVNTTGFINILIAAQAAKVQKVVYASSSAVYGHSNRLKKNETDVLEPVSPYAISKYINELYARSFNHFYDLDTIGLRYFNIFGPRQNSNGAYAPVIPLWIEAMLSGGNICIYGDGNQTRDFCYVEDVVQANILAALSIHEKNNIYNIGMGQEVTLNQLAILLKKLYNLLDLEIIHKDSRVGDIKISSADITSAKNTLQFMPSTSLETGLIQTIEYFKYKYTQALKEKIPIGVEE